MWILGQKNHFDNKKSDFAIYTNSEGKHRNTIKYSLMKR